MMSSHYSNTAAQVWSKLMDTKIACLTPGVYPEGSAATALASSQPMTLPKLFLGHKNIWGYFPALGLTHLTSITWVCFLPTFSAPLPGMPYFSKKIRFSYSLKSR